VVSQVLQDLDLEIEQKKAVIKIDELSTIQGHHRQLQQAFHNLIGNALKYIKAGTEPNIKISSQQKKGIDLAVSLNPQEQQQIYCVLTVEDNGIGFEQKDAERIFNVFTRLHGNGEFRGTGIGLSIVRKVMENHNGFVTARSDLGIGSTFSMYLPVG
jgi:signal transduction histidine kinase